MSTLYQLTGYYQQLIEMLDDPEIDQQTFQDTIAAISDEIEVKAENYAKIIRNLEVNVESIALEQKRLAARKNVLENSITRLKTNLQEAMIIVGKTKFKTDLFSFNIQKNGGKLPVIIDVETNDLPDEFVVITEKPNLMAIGTYLETHPHCNFAHYGERGETLRIK